MNGVIAGRYSLGEQLGRGGMATVVEGRDLRLDRPVAVKLLAAAPVGAADPAGRARFVREARSSAGFSHPHAVSVFDAGEADGFLYLVMELIDGPSLSTLLAEQGRLEVDHAVRIIDQVLQALAAAHRAGIVHRDVKPGNVLLTSGGDAKLADFGIAKRLDDLSTDITSAGQFVGTPRYLAPEQFLGGGVTAAADLYSSGVLLYEMLAGETPFDAPTPVALAIAHRDAPIPDVRALRSEVPARVAAVVHRAMAKVPADRFASADEMRSALAGGPVVPPAPVVITSDLPATEWAAAPVVPPAPLPPPAEATAVMPSRPATAPRPVRWALWLGLLAAVLLGGAALASLDGDDGDGDPTTATSTTALGAVPPPSPSSAARTDPPATTRPATTPPPPTTIPPTTIPPTTIPPSTAPATLPPDPPQSLDELLAVVDPDPERFGERGRQFRDDLRRLLDRGAEHAKFLDDAEKLREHTTDWAERDQLDAELAAVADELLAAYFDEDEDDEDGDG